MAKVEPRCGAERSSSGCFNNLADAQLRCTANHFDLVVCDYRLPDGNGLELADQSQGCCIGNPAFILISGDTSPEVLKKVVEMGHHLLHKPVRPAKLRSMMSFVLKKQDRSN